jgi:chromosomal replication initiator protein
MQAAAQQTWNLAQNHILSTLGQETFNLWFAPLRARTQDQSSLVLEVSDGFSEGWLKDNYVGVLREAVARASGQQLEIQFEVGFTTRHAQPAAVSAPAKPLERPAAPAQKRTTPAEALFNPGNNFESFVVGNNNNFAHAAALAVAQAPGKAYNPLFLYGGVGLGKTHLLHAIGNRVLTERKGARVAYLSSERFTNEYIDGIQNNQLGRFRSKYRQTDVLLIDDIQFLAGKERIQEEFFHTFNALHEAHKQIVLTCDRPAGEIHNLEQRLVSRFEWGLVTDLQPPDVEMRLAILRKKAEFLGMELPDEIMSFLANRIRTNIRRLEGALIRVASYASLTGRKLSLEAVEGLLREILHEEGRHTVTVDLIQKKVAEHYDLRLADMTSKRRPENIAFPRQVAMFLARQLTQQSLNTIGESFGGRDHGTVMHACRTVKDRMETDPHVRQVVARLESQLSR